MPPPPPTTGSLSELGGQEGLAHVVEHAVFTGTEALPSTEALRRVLSAFGMSYAVDSNALTDLRRTVFQFHAPARVDEDGGEGGEGGEGEGEEGEGGGEGGQDARLRGAATGDSGLRKVLHVLHQLAFKALIEDEAWQLERGTVVSELAQRNTADYRAHVRQISQLHAATAVKDRMPIGLLSAINSFTVDDIRAFYNKWYTPDRMVLFVVGHIDADATIDTIERLFAAETPSDAWCKLPPVDARVPRDNWMADAHRSYPPIVHALPTRLPDAHHVHTFDTFHHDLMEETTLMLTRLEPLRSFRSEDDWVSAMVDSVLHMVFEARIFRDFQSQADPAYTSIAWEDDDSHRDGAFVNGMSVSCAKPEQLMDALAIMAREAHQLAVHGVTPGEIESTLATMLADLTVAAQQDETRGAGGVLDDLMGCFELDHVMMSRKQELALFVRLAPLVTREACAARAPAILDFVANFVHDERRDCTCFIMGPPPPEPFQVDSIIAVMRAAMETIVLPEDTPVPDNLVDVEQLRAVADETGVHFLPVAEWLVTDRDGPLKPDGRVADDGLARIDETGTSGARVVRLSNGLRVTVKEAAYDAGFVRMRILIRGGRACESKDDSGALSLGLATWLSSGCGTYDADIISRYAQLHTVDFGGSVDDETLTLSASFPASEFDAAMGLVHTFLEKPHFRKQTFLRTQRLWASGARQDSKDLERVVDRALLYGLLPEHAHRIANVDAEQLERVTMDAAEDALRLQLHPDNIEVVIVGDVEIDTMLSFCHTYLGTLTDRHPTERATPEFGLTFADAPVDLAVTVAEEEDRCSAGLAFPGPSFYGRIPDVLRPLVPHDDGQLSWPRAWEAYIGTPLPDGVAERMRGDMYSSRLFTLAARCLNNLLFQDIRERRGLLYDISFGVTYFDRHNAGICAVYLTPSNEKLDETLAAVETMLATSADVLNEAELADVVSPLQASIDTGFRSSQMWLTLTGGLAVGKTSFAAIGDLPTSFSAFTLAEVRMALRLIGAMRVGGRPSRCVGTTR